MENHGPSHVRQCFESKESSYSIRSAFSEDGHDLTVRQSQARKVLGIQGLSLSDKTGGTERQRLTVGGKQAVLFLELLVHLLTDRAVGSVCSDQDIPLCGCAVGEAEANTFLCLFGGNNFLAHVHVFLGDMTNKEVADVRSRDNEPVGPKPICDRNDGSNQGKQS